MLNFYFIFYKPDVWLPLISRNCLKRHFYMGKHETAPSEKVFTTLPFIYLAFVLLTYVFTYGARIQKATNNQRCQSMLGGSSRVIVFPERQLAQASFHR